MLVAQKAPLVLFHGTFASLQGLIARQGICSMKKFRNFLQADPPPNWSVPGKGSSNFDLAVAVNLSEVNLSRSFPTCPKAGPLRVFYGGCHSGAAGAGADEFHLSGYSACPDAIEPNGRSVGSGRTRRLNCYHQWRSPLFSMLRLASLMCAAIILAASRHWYIPEL